MWFRTMGAYLADNTVMHAPTCYRCYLPVFKHQYEHSTQFVFQWHSKQEPNREWVCSTCAGSVDKDILNHVPWSHNG